VLLAIADDALVTGHRAAHWTGVAPTLEEDLAFATIAQDGVNHADLWYQVLVGEDHPRLRAAVDAIGLGRDPTGYRHAVLCEHEPRDFAFTLARHWVTTELEAVRLDVLRAAPDGAVAALAGKLRHELRYHREHAALWVDRLVADEEAHGRFRAALEVVLPEVAGFLEPVTDEEAPDAQRILPAGHPGCETRSTTGWPPACTPAGTATWPACSESPHRRASVGAPAATAPRSPPTSGRR
jgi:ring-1,2-phenylacetyl-CoA epoxidase subunit PaaC